MLLAGDPGLCLPGPGGVAGGLQEEAQVAQPPRRDGQGDLLHRHHHHQALVHISLHLGIRSSSDRLLSLPSLLLVELTSVVTSGQEV